MKSYKKLFFLTFFLLLLPLVSTQNQTITFSKLYIENTTLCSDDYSYINIFAYDKNNNSVSLDGLQIETSLNITAELVQSSDRSIYTVIISNFTEENNTITVNATGNQRGKIISQEANFEIKNCKDWKSKWENKLKELENNFFSNWFYWIMGIFVTIAILVLIIIFWLASREK